MSYLREFADANMQDFLYATDLETPDMFLEVARSILKCKSQLTHREREMLATFCLSLNNALQPIHVHGRNFELLGGKPGLVQDLVRDPSYQAVDAKLHPLLVLIRKLTEKADSVCKADHELCYAQGWNSHSIHLVIMLTGFFNQMARWVNGNGFKYSAEEIIGSSDYLVNQGYGPNDTPGLNDDEYKAKFPDYLETNLGLGDQTRVNIAG